MQAEWKFKNYYNADASKVASEIENTDGTAEQVLEKARNDDSELHKCFTWDDSIAAEKYRLEEAKRIIRMLVIKTDKEDLPQVRAFQITTVKGVYQPTKMFLVQEDEYQSLLKRAKAELEAFKKRYATLSELEEVFEAIDAL